MRVFLDTNVLASALATRGLCTDVLREVTSHHTLVTCTKVEVELHRTLVRKFRMPAALADETIATVLGPADHASSIPHHDLPGLDEADRAVASAAANGKADLLVTGDGAVRKSGAAGGTTVVTPREFWERIRHEAP